MQKMLITLRKHDSLEMNKMYFLRFKFNSLLSFYLYPMYATLTLNSEARRTKVVLNLSQLTLSGPAASGQLLVLLSL